MRRLLLFALFICLFVGVASAQVAKTWVNRHTYPGAADTEIIGTRHQVVDDNGTAIPFVTAVVSVTMPDGRNLFEVRVTDTNGTLLWSRVVEHTTGKMSILAKDFQIAAITRDIAVLAETKDRPDGDLELWRWDWQGNQLPTVKIAAKWVDSQLKLHDVDEHAVGLKMLANGQSVVLSSEDGDPAKGTIPAIRQYSRDGDLEWTNRFASAAGIPYNPPVNVPIAISNDIRDESTILVRTAATIKTGSNPDKFEDTKDNITVVRYGKDGSMLFQQTFDLTGSSGGTTFHFSDVPKALTVDGSGITTVVGTSRIGQPFMPFDVDAETIVQFSATGAVSWFRNIVQSDEFGRPGDFRPKMILSISPSSPQIAIVGSENPFDAPETALVQGFSSAGQPLFSYRGGEGFFNYVENNGSSTGWLATGAIRSDVDGVVGQRGIVAEVSFTGQERWRFLQADSVKKDGTRGVMVSTDGQFTYVGYNENKKLGGGLFAKEATVVAYRALPFVTSIEVVPGTVIGGDTFKATFTLNRKAGSKGYDINLDISNAAVTPPAVLRFKAGEDKATFVFQTSAVNTKKVVSLVAQPNATASATITVDTGWVATLALSARDVLGTQGLTGTVTLNKPAPPGNARISLDATSAAIILPKDNVVTIGAGKTSVTFNIGTRAVATKTDAFVSATYSSTARLPLTIHPPEVTSFTTPATIQGGSFGVGTIVISGPAPSGGLQIPIVTDAAALAGMTAVVPQGKTTVNVRLYTIPVETDTVVGLTASTANAVIKSTTTVLAPVLTGVTIDPSTVTGGTNSYMLVQLSGDAPAGGTVVSLKSDSSHAIVPATVTVPAGTSRVKVAIKTTKSVNTLTAKITATLKAVSVQGTLTILP